MGTQSYEPKYWDLVDWKHVTIQDMYVHTWLADMVE